MSIVSIIVAFFTLFFIGCVIAMVAMVITAEEQAEEEYFSLENLEILDIITGGDDEE